MPRRLNVPDSPQVSSELLDGKGLTIPALAEILPKNSQGKHVSVSTVYNWISAGISLPDGKCVRLEIAHIGVRAYTSREALKRFMDACNGKTGEIAQQSPSPTLQRRGHDINLSRQQSDLHGC